MTIDLLGPVLLEPMMEGHQQLLSGTSSIPIRENVITSSKVLLHPVCVGQTLKSSIHEACVAQVCQTQKTLFALLLALASKPKAGGL
jgi:hypothetical protein